MCSVGSHQTRSGEKRDAGPTLEEFLGGKKVAPQVAKLVKPSMLVREFLKKGIPF